MTCCPRLAVVLRRAFDAHPARDVQHPLAAPWPAGPRPGPDADNPIHTVVSGAGTFAGADNGKEDDPEGYTSPTHDAFNGKELSIVQARTRPGPVTVRVSAPGLVPATATLYSSDGTRRGLIALETADVRTPRGDAPALPATVLGVNGDGQTHALPVHWNAPAHLNRPGTVVVQGTVTGTSIPARALVTVYALARVRIPASVTPVGVPAILPATATVTDTDGVTQQLAVRWSPVRPRRYARAGRFTVRGVIPALGRPVRVSVIVTRHFRSGQDLALGAGQEHPVADASFSGGVFADGGSDGGTSTTVPSAMLDGVTTSGGWSNRYTKAATQTLPEISASHPEDWVSITWPHAQRIAQLNVDYTLDDHDQLPASVRVTYWNGLAWVPVTGQHVSYETTSDQPTTIGFEPVGTTAVRLDMTSRSPHDPTTGNLTIAEITVPGDEVVPAR